jgi:short subunit fatty acids transporter
VHTPRQAIIVATIVGCVGSYLNWGFGLVIGGIMARKLALKVKGVHYPLIIASAYTGFTMYSLGFSATIPVLISTKGHTFESSMGLIPDADHLLRPHAADQSGRAHRPAAAQRRHAPQGRREDRGAGPRRGR